jgi:outer membrane protein TolC
MRQVAVVMVVMIGVAFASAEALSAGDLSLEQALVRAVESNPVMGAATAEVEAAEAGIKIASARFWPTLSASGSYGTFSGDVLYGRFIPGAPGNGVIPVGEYDTNQVANLELKQVLYAGGAIGAEKRLRTVEREVADQTLRERRLEIEYQVTQTYYEAVLAEHRLEVAGRSVERSRSALETVRARHAEQEALEVELLGAAGKLAADELALLEAGKALGLAHRKLGVLLGSSGEEMPRLTTALDPPLDLLPKSEALDRAVATGPAVEQANLMAVHAEAAVGVARAIGRPKLEFVGLYSWIDNDLFFKGDYAAVSINLAVPFIQDIKAGRASKKVAEARGRQAAHLRREAVDRTGLAVETGFGQLEVALAAVEVARLNLEFQTENFRVTQSAYREQLVTFSEVLDRHDALSNAELDLFGAQFEARMAEAELRRLVGD